MHEEPESESSSDEEQEEMPWDRVPEGRFPSQARLRADNADWIDETAESAVSPELLPDSQYGNQVGIDSEQATPLRRLLRATTDEVSSDRNLLVTTMQRRRNNGELGRRRRVVSMSRSTTQKAKYGRTGHTEELAEQTLQRNSAEVTSMIQPRSHCGNDPGLSNCRREYQLATEDRANYLQPYPERNDFIRLDNFGLRPHLDERGYRMRPTAVSSRPKNDAPKKRKREYMEAVLSNEALRKAQAKAAPLAKAKRQATNEEVERQTDELREGPLPMDIDGEEQFASEDEGTDRWYVPEELSGRLRAEPANVRYFRQDEGAEFSESSDDDHNDNNEWERE